MMNNPIWYTKALIELVIWALAEKDRSVDVPLWCYLPKEMQGNMDVVIAAAAGNWVVLGHMSGSLQDNDKVVKAAIDADPRALQFASKRLQREHYDPWKDYGRWYGPDN